MRSQPSRMTKVTWIVHHRNRCCCQSIGYVQAAERASEGWGVLELGDHDVLPGLAGRLPALMRRHRVPGAQVALYRNGHLEALELGELRYRCGERVTRDAAFPIG